MGYWLFNYVLTFPGPILNATAAAAYLNLKKQSFQKSEVQNLIVGCKYEGPFSKVEPYFWRDKLASVLEKSDGEIKKAPELQGIQLESVVADPAGVAFMCLLTDEPISEEEASPSLDWIPSGAQLARIRSDVLDQIDPMLSS